MLFVVRLFVVVWLLVYVVSPGVSGVLSDDDMRCLLFVVCCCLLLFVG